MTRPTLPPGADVGGYRIVSALGTGANGTVYRAVDGGGQPVAIKVLHAGPETDESARARLAREAATLHRLDHPAVADVLDVELEGESPFIVTELVEGRSLEDDVAIHGPYDEGRLAGLATDLADALHAVHAAGVVHRDLKPSNVMVTTRGPVLIDFGIAHGLEDARMTSEGLVMGTPGYLAPEMLTGTSPSQATDWWGWAASLAFAATGRAPFGVSPVDAVLARAQAGTADLRGIGPRRAQAIAGALRPDPARRWEPGTVVRELRAAADAGDPVVAQVGAPGAATVTLGATAALEAGQPTEIVTTSPGTTPVNDGRTQALPQGAVPPPPAPPAPYEGTAGTEVFDDPDGTTWLDELETDDETPGYERPVHARRAALLTVLTLPFLAAATTWPAISFGALAVLVVLARDVGVASDALHTRRERRGVSRSDGWRVGVASPWHLLRALVGALPALLVGGCVGLLLVVGSWWFLGRTVLADDPDVAGQQNAPWVFAVTLALAMLVVVVCTWFGPAGRRARVGARTAFAHLVPGRRSVLIVVVLAVAAAVALALPALHGHEIVWWPFPGAPDLG
jgi:tRNA A-37 threonylcarbamoyl transferase component Bud32